MLDFIWSFWNFSLYENLSYSIDKEKTLDILQPFIVYLMLINLLHNYKSYFNLLKVVREEIISFKSAANQLLKIFKKLMYILIGIFKRKSQFIFFNILF